MPASWPFALVSTGLGDRDFAFSRIQRGGAVSNLLTATRWTWNLYRTSRGCWFNISQCKKRHKVSPRTHLTLKSYGAIKNWYKNVSTTSKCILVNVQILLCDLVFMFVVSLFVSKLKAFAFVLFYSQ